MFFSLGRNVAFKQAHRWGVRSNEFGGLSSLPYTAVGSNPVRSFSVFPYDMFLRLLCFLMTKTIEKCCIF